MFDDMVILFTYSKNGIKKEESFWGNHTGVDFKAELQLEEGDGTCRLKLLLTPFGVLKTDGIQIFCSYKFDQSCRILVNGYQSWSRTREYFTGERMKRIPLVAAPLKKTHKIDKYGDSCFYKYPGEKGRFHGYTYGYVRKGRNFSLLGSLTEKNGYTIIEYNTAGNSVNIIKECEGLSINTPYEAFDLIWAEGSESFVFDAWFDAMGLPKTACRPANGWTSWYNYYQKISEAIILENLENIQRAENKPGIFQIDDGYQTAVGDWLSVDADKFPNGMKHAADRIKAAGMKAGLWLAPFVCEKKSAVYREKKEWLLKDAKGRPVGSGCNWSGSFALDFYNKEVRDYIRKVFSTVLNEWGFDLVKLDFLYAVCLEPCRDKTRGAVMTEAMQFLRECAGDKILLGCGVPLGPSFGLADYCRIGCDIGPDWDSNAVLRFIVPEYVSTRNAVFNAIARRQLNNRAFLNDPDVFLLRDNNIKMSEMQKRTLFTANYLFGSLLFTSDNTGAYDDVQWELYNMTGRSVSRTITHVEQDRNGLIEIFFEEDGQSMLALINLGGRKAKYIGGPALGCEIVYGGGPTGAAPRNGIVGLKPCETRIFRLA